MFKEFDLPKLFDISTTKSVDKNKLDFVADGEYDFIGRTSVNWGLQGKLHRLSFKPNPKDSFSLIQVGETVALWREREWYASQNLFLLNPKIDKIKENKLYFQSAINKEMSSRYGKAYNSYPTMKSLAVTKIFLPVIENPNPDHEYTVNDIDWQYMRDRIAELERDRIAELDAYLKVTGLDDYILTDEDKKILSNATQHEFKEFAVKDILPPINIKKYAKKPESKGNIPFVSCQTTNNGIASYCGEVPEVSHCITVSTNGNCFDCFWHNYPIIPSSDVEVLHKDGITDNAEISLCLCSALSLNTRLYSYSNKPKNGKVFDTIIFLPVIESSDPDHEYTVDDINWQYMERYIRTMEKVVVADVVRYKDRVIEETRKLVS